MKTISKLLLNNFGISAFKEREKYIIYSNIMFLSLFYFESVKTKKIPQRGVISNFNVEMRGNTMKNSGFGLLHFAHGFPIAIKGFK